MGDRFHFVELGSTRQLVVSEPPKTSNAEAMLFGGIQYEMDTAAIGAANAMLKNDLLASRGALSFENTDSLLRQGFGGRGGGTWSFLRWTEKEINSIAPILTSAGLKPTTRSGFSATEEFFKSIGSNANVGRVSNPSDVDTKSPRIFAHRHTRLLFPRPKNRREK